MIQPDKITEFIEINKDIQKHFTIYDMHVHPFDVFSSDTNYCACREDPQLFSMNQTPFSRPVIDDCTDIDEGRRDDTPNTCLEKRICLMLLKRLYYHTGPRVFKAHMDLSGIDKALLLPVAPNCGDIDDQMKALACMFGADKRFVLAASVPNTIPNSEIKGYLDEMISTYKVKAVKLHPNISEINLAAHDGKTRVESILCACGEAAVPLIIHGGESKLLENAKASSFAILDHLTGFNWSHHDCGVIIAHGGLHSVSKNQIETDILPKLKKMISLHDNVFIDISDLGIQNLILVFKNIDTEKILFGSDALYNTQWSSIVKTMYALSKTKDKLEDSFVQIASINPSKLIFKVR